jgi:hypothetical protein
MLVLTVVRSTPIGSECVSCTCLVVMINWRVSTHISITSWPRMRIVYCLENVDTMKQQIPTNQAESQHLAQSAAPHNMSPPTNQHEREVCRIDALYCHNGLQRQPKALRRAQTRAWLDEDQFLGRQSQKFFRPKVAAQLNADQVGAAEIRKA